MTAGASDSALMLTMCALQMFVLLLFFLAHQHKAAGVKTEQNVKQRLLRLLIRCSLC